MASIEIRGVDKLIRKLDTLGKLGPVKAAIKASAAHIKGKIDKYPPATEGNNPANRQWYQRGFGPKWRRKDGSIGSRKTSETLGRKWTTTTRDNGLTGVVGNNVSYSPFVHDPDEQTWFHEAHGWKTTETVAREEARAVRQFVENAIRKAINGL